jgi:flagellar biosynthesis/type III secretory pathway protein FliH
MSQTLTVCLERPVASAKLLGDGSKSVGAEVPDRGAADSGVSTGQTRTQESEAQKAMFLQACKALNGVITKLNQFCDRAFVEHKEKIAKLSVEIARKILMRKVENGDYEIESIVKEALNNAPTRQELVVHLNPQDLAKCQKAQQDEPGSDLAGIKFVSDANIGRAECLLESPKGIIESLIDEHLERIGEALKKVG